MDMASRHVVSANGTLFRPSVDLAEARPYSHSQSPIHILHAVQQPPLAYTKGATVPVAAYAQHKERLKSSVSSASSTLTTSPSPHSPKQPQWPSPMAQHAHIHRPSSTAPLRQHHHNSHSHNHSHQPSPSRSHPSSHRPEMVERSTPSVTYVHHAPEYEEDENEHGIWILAYLSLLSPLHALTTSLITLLITLTLTLLSPFRLCTPHQPPLSDALIRVLAPFHRQHLQMIYAPSVLNAYTFVFSPTKLVLILITSPVLSLGVMAAAWISGAFWVFALIMGNPDGTERRDDGRDAVLAVRGWWERWFLKALTRSTGDEIRNERERIGSV